MNTKQAFEELPIIKLLSVKDPIYGDENKRAIESLRLHIEEREALAERKVAEEILDMIHGHSFKVSAVGTSVIELEQKIAEKYKLVLKEDLKGNI
jgi:hypothetical protein